jgi:hypothetical protein
LAKGVEPRLRISGIGPAACKADLDESWRATRTRVLEGRDPLIGHRAARLKGRAVQRLESSMADTLLMSAIFRAYNAFSMPVSRSPVLRSDGG